MTLTLTARRFFLVALAVISLTVVFLLGSTRSGGLSAAAGAGPADASSNQTAGIPLSSVPGVGGTGITVSGQADVAGTPDTLRLDLSVVASAPSVSDSLAKANGSASAVQKSLLGDGVAKKDLQTSGLTISPSYDYSKGGTARLTGYDVSESVSAKLGDLAHAGDVIGRAVGAGGNAVRVNRVSLDLADTGALVAKARDNAFANARAKAEQYARAAGRPLGDVVSIAESYASPTPTPMAALSPEAFSGDAKAAVPIQRGSQDVSVTVTAVFAMR